MPTSDSLVTITWEDDLPWVSVQNNWREHIGPLELGSRVAAAYSSNVGPARHRHRPPAPRGELSEEERRELHALRHDYVTARRRRGTASLAPMPQESTRVTGIGAKWRAGALSVIEFDLDWLDRASAQSLSDALTELLGNPPETEPHESTEVMDAIRNLERFGARHG